MFGRLPFIYWLIIRGSGGGPTPPPEFIPALQFNDARNSMYLLLGVM